MGIVFKYDLDNLPWFLDKQVCSEEVHCVKLHPCSTLFLNTQSQALIFVHKINHPILSPTSDFTNLRAYDGCYDI